MTPFEPNRGLIVVLAHLFGPGGERAVRMALDTGATTTTVRPAVLVRLGYDPAAGSQRVPMTTASGVEYVPRIAVSRIEALGERREPLVVVAHTLPPSATVDGLLGLDFFRGRQLALDFRRGVILLE